MDRRWGLVKRLEALEGRGNRESDAEILALGETVTDSELQTVAFRERQDADPNVHGATIRRLQARRACHATDAELLRIVRPAIEQTRHAVGRAPGWAGTKGI